MYQLDGKRNLRNLPGTWYITIPWCLLQMSWTHWLQCKMKYLHSNELPSNSQNTPMANITRLFCRGVTGVRVVSRRKMIEVCQYKWSQLVSVEQLPIGYDYWLTTQFSIQSWLHKCSATAKLMISLKKQESQRQHTGWIKLNVIESRWKLQR